MSCNNQHEKPIVAIANANRVLRASIPIDTKSGKTVELVGRSWAGDSTSFVVPSLGLALDAGYVVHAKRMDSVFITHCHTDHCHHMTHLKSLTKPPNVYLPAETTYRMENFLNVSQQLTSNLTPEEYNDIEWSTCYTLHGVKAGDRIIVNKKRGLICHVVPCDHRVPCVGYCFSQTKQELRKEYQGMPGPEIGKLSKQGVSVTTEVEQPLFCFLGDTTTSILDGPYAERILSCPTVIIECTFLTDDCRENAERTKHVLWSDLKPHIESHPETTFVLIHFSHRWSVQDVSDFFRKEALSNVIPWIPSNDIGLTCQPVNGSVVVDEVWSHF